MKLPSVLPVFLLLFFFVCLGSAVPAVIMRYQVNQQALELINVFFSRSGMGGSHWALNTHPALEANMRENLVCQYDDYRAGLWCGMTWLLSTPSRAQEHLAQFALEGFDDPIFRYYWGIALYPEDKQAAIAIWQGVPKLAFYFARQVDIRYDQRQFKEALLLGQIADEIDPETDYRKARMYLDLCDIRKQRGEIKEAIDLCNKAEMISNNWIGLVAVARQYLDLREFDRALRIANNLLDNPASSISAQSNAYRIRARVLIGRGEYQNALAEYKQAQGLGGADKYFLFEMAELYYNMRDYARSKAVFQEVIALDRGGSLLTERARHYLSVIEQSFRTPSR